MTPFQKMSDQDLKTIAERVIDASHKSLTDDDHLAQMLLAVGVRPSLISTMGQWDAFKAQVLEIAGVYCRDHHD